MGDGKKHSRKFSKSRGAKKDSAEDAKARKAKDGANPEKQGPQEAAKKDPLPPPVIPDALCEPVFVVDEQPRGEHLSRALELNVPVVVLRTSKWEPEGDDFVSVLLGEERLPSHPFIQRDYTGDPSLVPHFKQLWREFVREVKTRLAVEEQSRKKSRGRKTPNWDRSQAPSDDSPNSPGDGLPF